MQAIRIVRSPCLRSSTGIPTSAVRYLSNDVAAEAGLPNRRDAHDEYDFRAKTRAPRRRDRFCTGPYEKPGEERPDYPKRRTPFSRAKALINALHEEEGLAMIRGNRAKLAEFSPTMLPGDILRVDFGNPQRPMSFTGIVMAKRNRGLGSGIILRNVIDGVAVERSFPLYDPTVFNVERVAPRRKVARNKLYYLRDKKLKESTFTHKPPTVAK